MKWIRRIFRSMQVFIGVIISLVAFDMLVLGGKIKLWIIAVANTTTSSPFSTDGQSNWMLLFIGIGVIAFLAYLNRKFTPEKQDENKDKDDKQEQSK